jgi:D-alanyl-D-alanine carboxypeptidase/D-alanyl-D-alanine-endopeptidase (penicillin-binding protein 4)
VAAAFKDGLPILGVDGSLEGAGENLPGKGHVFAKTGTTVLPTADPKYLDLVAQNIAGYIETQSGRNVAFALILNDVGLIESVTEVVPVMQDQAAIASLIYESL